jgi:hypothetical protein
LGTLAWAEGKETTIMTGKSSGLALNELEVTINHVQREEVVVALKKEEEVVPVITNQEEALEALKVAFLTTSLISNKKSSPLIIVSDTKEANNTKAQE